jgi:electron transfer flavoprotein alpha subunit
MEDFTMKRIMNNCSPYRGQVAQPRLAIAALALLALAGCASAPEAPTESLRAAEMAIAHAEQARVADYAAPELGTARRLLSAARDAVADEEMALAWRLAEQSRANAELAYAKAEAAKAAAVNEEMQKSIDALKQEMQRNSGGRQ